MKKCGIITGATGQDGSYLTELLLEKGYTVLCMVRRTTYKLEDSNIRDVLHKIKVFDADVLDQPSVLNVFIHASKFDEIEVYNLAAQSDVGVSFKCPSMTIETNFIGTLNILETIKQLNLTKKCKLYHASTSEMFGKVQAVPQTETTPFYPRSPYGVSKVGAHWLVKNYRESYELFACCGILFNHESPRRGDKFVTQKVVKGLGRVLKGHQDKVTMGNLDSLRDWGHAKDYVKGMWLMLQQSVPDDYIIATGEQHSVREFIECVAKEHSKDIVWEGSGVSEVGKIDGNVVVDVSEEFYRPCEVDSLVGDPTKMKSIGWQQEHGFEDLVKDMVRSSKSL
jgi:GDPmannose 4,6-dehydratase